MWFLSRKEIQAVVREALCQDKDEHGNACKLKRELEELKLKKELEIKEIEHLVKMNEEKQTIEATKKELELQRKFQEKEMALQTKHHDNVLKTIEKAHEDIKTLYGEIMKRLPDVNMTIQAKR